MPIGSLKGFRKIFAVEEVPDATSHDVKEGFEAQVAKLWRTVSDKRKHLFQAEGFNLFRRRKKKPEWGPAGALGFGCGVGVGVGLTGGMGIAAKPWEQFRLAVGVGAGCGVGIGYGYCFGVGVCWDQPPRWIRRNIVVEL